MANEARCYVFRINYNSYYKMLLNEIKVRHLLRQGWGTNDMCLDSFESYLEGWAKAGWEADESYIRRKYNNLSIMKNIRPGDYIIVPRVSLDEGKCYPCDSFLVARCKSVYQFLPLDGVDDFCHTIELETEDMFSCAYHYNNASQIISKKFKAYQSPLNNVHRGEFIKAIESLEKEHEKSPKNFGNNNDLIAITHEATKYLRLEYLKKIRDHLRFDIKPDEFEKIITSLFEKNGYAKVAGNKYDRKGGDIDIIFEPYPEGSLMSSLYSFTSIPMPLIYVQAKKKWGTDMNAKEGVLQLIQMQDQGTAKNPTLILINLTDEFPEDAKQLASDNDVILINGIEFADLLVRYGIDIG